MEAINELEGQSRLGGSQPSIKDAPPGHSQATSKASVHVQKYLNSIKYNPPAAPPPQPIQTQRKVPIPETRGGDTQRRRSSAQ